MHASLTAGMLILQPLAMAGTTLLIWLLAWAAAWWVAVAVIVVVHHVQISRRPHYQPLHVAGNQ